MSLMEAVRIALVAVRTNRLRSVLTMLGIIIGVAAVIFLVAVGNGVQSSVNKTLTEVADLITVVPVSLNVPGGVSRDLTDADAVALRNSAQAPDIASVTPVITGGTLVETPTTVSHPNVVGSTERWFEVNNRTLKAGSFFGDAQVHSGARVLVIGRKAASDLLGGDSAAVVGQTLRINHQSFTVIGLLDSASESADNTVVMPLSTARRFVFGAGDALNEVIVRATHAAAVTSARDQVINILSERHRITNPAKRDFEANILAGELTALNHTLDVLTTFAASVAAISLFVGGIGVLNVMLVSVTERTREIGIRRAVGATRRAILEQFLIESIVLAGAGGLIGIGVGIGLSALATTITPYFGDTFGGFTPTVSIPSTVTSFAISLAIGLLAGAYPANRAARTPPIHALRHE
ncbi:MAG: ABC transporter permease [Pseudonocardiaceae bacterium]